MNMHPSFPEKCLQRLKTITPYRASKHEARGKGIWTTLLGMAVLAALQPAAIAGTQYTFNLNLPLNLSLYGPSNVSWSFTVPSILTNTTYIAAANLDSQSVTGVLAAQGCTIQAVEITSPPGTGLEFNTATSNWVVATYLQGCNLVLTNIYVTPLASSGIYTSSPSTFSGTLGISLSLSGLAQVAAGGTLTTGFYVSNTSAKPAKFTINLYDDTGKPLSLPFTNGNASGVSGTLQPAGSAYYEAGNDPKDPVTQGWAQITSDSSIVVQGLFRNLVNGINYEAAIPAIGSGSSDVTFPFDDTTFGPTGQPLVTGIALANFDGVNPAAVTCVARDPNGVIILNAIQVPMLAPLGHWAGSQFPALNGLRGTIECTSSTSISATALRFLGNALSSLPVVAK